MSQATIALQPRRALAGRAARAARSTRTARSCTPKRCLVAAQRPALGDVQRVRRPGHRLDARRDHRPRRRRNEPAGDEDAEYSSPRRTPQRRKPTSAIPTRSMRHGPAGGGTCGAGRRGLALGRRCRSRHRRRARRYPSSPDEALSAGVAPRRTVTGPSRSHGRARSAHRHPHAGRVDRAGERTCRACRAAASTARVGRLGSRGAQLAVPAGVRYELVALEQRDRVGGGGVLQPPALLVGVVGVGLIE